MSEIEEQIRDIIEHSRYDEEGMGTDCKKAAKEIYKQFFDKEEVLLEAA